MLTSHDLHNNNQRKKETFILYNYMDYILSFLFIFIITQYLILLNE